MASVKTISDEHDRRRVEIFQNHDGTYGFDEWKWADEEQSWILVRNQMATITDTAAVPSTRPANDFVVALHKTNPTMGHTLAPARQWLR
jgi:hypothetical protein